MDTQTGANQSLACTSLMPEGEVLRNVSEEQHHIEVVRAVNAFSSHGCVRKEAHSSSLDRVKSLPARFVDDLGKWCVPPTDPDRETETWPLYGKY